MKGTVSEISYVNDKNVSLKVNLGQVEMQTITIGTEVEVKRTGPIPDNTLVKADLFNSSSRSVSRSVSSSPSLCDDDTQSKPKKRKTSELTLYDEYEGVVSHFNSKGLTCTFGDDDECFISSDFWGDYAPKEGDRIRFELIGHRVYPNGTRYSLGDLKGKGLGLVKTIQYTIGTRYQGVVKSVNSNGLTCTFGDDDECYICSLYWGDYKEPKVGDKIKFEMSVCSEDSSYPCGIMNKMGLGLVKTDFVLYDRYEGVVKSVNSNGLTCTFGNGEECFISERYWGDYKEPKVGDKIRFELTGKVTFFSGSYSYIGVLNKKGLGLIPNYVVNEYYEGIIKHVSNNGLTCSIGQDDECFIGHSFWGKLEEPKVGDRIKFELITYRVFSDGQKALLGVMDRKGTDLGLVKIAPGQKWTGSIVKILSKGFMVTCGSSNVCYIPNKLDLPVFLDDKIDYTIVEQKQLPDGTMEYVGANFARTGDWDIPVMKGQVANGVVIGISNDGIFVRRGAPSLRCFISNALIPKHQTQTFNIGDKVNFNILAVEGETEGASAKLFCIGSMLGVNQC